MASSMLLKNGTALIHGEGDIVTPMKTDILIQGDKIHTIEPNIVCPGAQIIDCTDKIISPGFIDTHHHVWQTQNRGMQADHTLLQYFPSGNFVASLYTPEDTFWGQLGGCAEMVNCGTTTVVDFAHLNYSPEHSKLWT
jgi:cytosine/adenosine deaminase-related metal-dependent hydrolase